MSNSGECENLCEFHVVDNVREIFEFVNLNL